MGSGGHGRLLRAKLAWAAGVDLGPDILTHGKRLELEALQGHAVKLGVRYAVPTPTLFAVYAALNPYLSGLPQAFPV